MSPSSSASTKDHLLRLAQKLPTSPQIFSRLTLVLNDVNAELGKIVNLISIDAGLTARVLRLSNSVFFRGATAVQSIDEAISRVGFHEVHKMVGVAMTEQIAKGGLPSYGLSAADVWENSVTTAVAMETLARETGEDTHSAYTVGLLRQIGKLVLGRILEKDHPGVVCPDDIDLGTWERARLNFASHEAAAIILESWKLPPAVHRGVRYHYQPEGSGAEINFSALLHVACWMTESLGKGMRVEAPLWELTEERLSLAHVSKGAIQDCLEETKRSIEKLKNELAVAA